MFRPVSSALRSSRESLCSEVSTSSSCTGEAVWVTLIVSPESSVGEPGVPGLRSTKKLPSRKMRGRTLAVASSCSGSAESLSSIVISAALEPSTPVTDLTLPTSTPAIRTGELGRIEFADSNWALIWKPCVNGMSLVKPKNRTSAARISPIRPMKAFERRGVWRRARAITCVSGVALGPGLLRARDVGRHRLAGQELLVAGLALTRLARRGGVRVRVGVQVVGLQSGRWPAPTTGRPRCSGPAAW